MSGKDLLFWRQNIRIVSLLLAVWFVVSYGLGILFVEPLNQLHLGGFPLGFWFAQQGSIYVFVVLTLVYAILLDRLDAGVRADTKATGTATTGATTTEDMTDEAERETGP